MPAAVKGEVNPQVDIAFILLQNNGFSERGSFAQTENHLAVVFGTRAQIRFLTCSVVPYPSLEIKPLTGAFLRPRNAAALWSFERESRRKKKRPPINRKTFLQTSKSAFLFLFCL
ncbi:hypothetical protein [uncultured Neglectibacter sp.]|uniref:hypothetical protein n=1 Tax=uncultured Neglectibacter sp. TaxID=1924108 RepID=UPI0034DEAEF0